MSKLNILKVIETSAFHQINTPRRVIHAFAGGSALHGASLPGRADLDVYGLFIEPRVNVFGLTPFEHFVSSTSGDNTRNTSKDIDITLYSLRKWARLAVSGNPTALGFLFASNEVQDISLWGECRDDLKNAVVAKRAVNSFRGFVTNQMQRLLAEKGRGKHGQRPELEELHGYDTKAAMHAVRLTHEAIELMKTGAITYPRPEVEYLRKIRQGAYSLDTICQHVSGYLSDLTDAENESHLQDKPDLDEVNSVLVNAYTEFYS